MCVLFIDNATKLFIVILVFGSVESGVLVDIFHLLKDRLNEKVNAVKGNFRDTINKGLNYLYGYGTRGEGKNVNIMDQISQRLHNISEDFKKNLRNPLRILDKNKDWDGIFVNISTAAKKSSNKKVDKNMIANGNDSIPNWFNYTLQKKGFNDYQDYEDGSNNFTDETFKRTRLKTHRSLYVNFK